MSFNKPFIVPTHMVRLAVAVLLTCSLQAFFVSHAQGSTSVMIQETVALLKAENYAGAIDKLHELDEAMLNPDELDNLWVAAYLGRGYQLLSLGKLAEAKAQFQKGRQHKEDEIRLWQGEAMTWYKEGQFAEASYLLDRALGYDPQNADLYHLLGRAYYAQGRMPEALEALKTSLQLEENNAVRMLLLKVTKEWQVEQEMDQDYRGSFKLSFVDGEGSAPLARDVLAALEKAYASLGSSLNYYPDVTVPVLLYTRSEYSALTGSPDWSGALYDGKIRLPLVGFPHLNDQLVALLYHEYMHVIVHYMANHQAPVWLNEGLAEVAGRSISPVEGEALLGPDNKAGLLDWGDLSQPFANLKSDQVKTAYEQSYSLVNYMVENFGWYKMAELLKELAKGQKWQDSVAAVYIEFGLDWPAIQKEWQAAVMRR